LSCILVDEKGFIDSEPPPLRKEGNSDDDEKYVNKPFKSPVGSRKVKGARNLSREQPLREPSIRLVSTEEEARRILDWQEDIARFGNDIFGPNESCRA